MIHRSIVKNHLLPWQSHLSCDTDKKDKFLQGPFALRTVVTLRENSPAISRSKTMSFQQWFNINLILRQTYGQNITKDYRLHSGPSGFAPCICTVVWKLLELLNKTIFSYNNNYSYIMMSYIWGLASRETRYTNKRQFDFRTFWNERFVAKSLSSHRSISTNYSSITVTTKSRFCFSFLRNPRCCIQKNIKSRITQLFLEEETIFN